MAEGIVPTGPAIGAAFADIPHHEVGDPADEEVLHGVQGLDFLRARVGLTPTAQGEPCPP